jgi:hypothetical protein
MLQVRNVRPEVHGELVRRAKLRGQTLTAYIEEILEREVARPDRDEVFDRIESRGPMPLGATGVELVRAVRDEEDAWWDRWWSTRRP